MNPDLHLCTHIKNHSDRHFGISKDERDIFILIKNGVHMVNDHVTGWWPATHTIFFVADQIPEIPLPILLQYEQLLL